MPSCLVYVCPVTCFCKGWRGSLPWRLLASLCTHPEACQHVVYSLVSFSFVVLCVFHIVKWVTWHCTPPWMPASRKKKTYLTLRGQNYTRLGPDSCPCDQCRCSFLGVIAPSRLPLLVLAVFGDLRELDSTASLVTLFDFVSFCLFCSFWFGCPPLDPPLVVLGGCPSSIWALPMRA